SFRSNISLYFHWINTVLYEHYVGIPAYAIAISISEYEFVFVTAFIAYTITAIIILKYNCFIKYVILMPHNVQLFRIIICLYYM
ncbi:hypothetical protein ACJX0J_013670, partial [Zea mays]